MTFNDWMHDTEPTGIRLDVLYKDLEDIPPGQWPRLIEWLRTSYNAGYEQGKLNDIV